MLSAHEMGPKFLNFDILFELLEQQVSKGFAWAILLDKNVIDMSPCHTEGLVAK